MSAATEPEAQLADDHAAKPKKTISSRIESISRQQANAKPKIVKTAEERKREERMAWIRDTGIIILCLLTLLIPVFGFRYMIGLLVFIGVLLPIYLVTRSLQQLHLNFSAPKEPAPANAPPDAPSADAAHEEAAQETSEPDEKEATS